MNSRTQNLLIAFGLILLVIGFGAVEDWYTYNYYGGDGIAYIDNATAFRHGDWALALNPYWSMGYPLVLAATRWMFPSGWAGDWIAIHVVNLVIYAAAYASFIYLLQQAVTYATKISGSAEPVTKSRSLFVVGSLIFVEWQVQIKGVAALTPDLMVSGIFFLLTAFSLQFCLRPTVSLALRMGLVAGFGYIAKAAFLPVSLMIFFVVVIRVFTQPGANRFAGVWKLAWGAPPMALLVLPYVLALSLSVGHFTLGESGGLNYAWVVNKLTHWHWTGGPVAFGEPIHPVRLPSTSPHVYEYAEPMHVTYPPFYNIYYWYEGYHHFFSLKNQIAAIKANLFELNVTFFSTPHAPIKAGATIALLIAAAFVFADKVVLLRRLLALWPLYIPSLLGTAMYIVVCLEPRYIVGFVIVVMMTPLLAVFIPTPVVGRRVGLLILILVSLVSLTYLIKDTRPELDRAMRHESYTNHEDWRIAFYLKATGIAPGTKVAMVKIERGIQTTWAFVPGLHIAGQIGSQDFTEAEQQQDFDLFINSPEVQQNVFEIFHKAGAELVVAFDVPGAPKGEGWTQIPATKAWLHRL